MSDGRLLQVNVSAGGVPKLSVPAARVTSAGVEGDRQREVTVHGGPHRAVSILGIEAIRRIAAEGHPIGPGTTGENLTVEGFDVSLLPIGTRLRIGDELVLELASPANPCRTIRHSFADLRFGRLGVAANPADSRMYARVIREGVARPGDAITLEPPRGDAAERHRLAARLDRADRASTLAIWRAAERSGAPIAILDDGELAAAAAPSLPDPAFNQALGFAHLPNLVDRAVEHFRGHGGTGWVWADAPPWPGAVSDGRAIHAAADIAAALRAPAPEGPPGLVIRELGRDELGAWMAVIVDAIGAAPEVARAWRALEPELARAAHGHRYAAEIDGRVVGTGLLFTHHGVGWLRAGTVLAAHRGAGIQAALIRTRVEAARRLGCDLVGASAADGGTSARNLERAGFSVVAVRDRYRVDPA